MKKFIIPLIAFALIGALLWKGLSLNPKHIPSPLIGKALPWHPLGEIPWRFVRCPGMQFKAARAPTESR